MPIFHWTILGLNTKRRTRLAAPLDMTGGTGLVAWDSWTTPLGFISDDSLLDLDGNGELDAGEPTGAAVLAV